MLQTLLPWKEGGTLAHTCQHGVALRLLDQCLSDQRGHGLTHYISITACATAVCKPESEGRWPGCMTSPRTKAFGPFSAGSSAKDSTKSSYSLAAASASFCTGGKRCFTDKHLHSNNSVARCRVGHNANFVPSFSPLPALYDAVKDTNRSTRCFVQSKTASLVVGKSYLKRRLLLADCKREA